MSFADFWSAYPKRRPHPNPRATALKAYNNAVKRGVKEDDLVRGAKNYAAYVKNNNIKPVYVCMASTFLNQDRYEDFVDYQEEVRSISEAFFGHAR